MKRIIAALLALVPALSFGAANDLFINQRDSTNTNTLTRLVTHPAGTADGVFGYIGSTQLPGFLQIGPGLTLVNGVLDAGASAAPTWASITGKPAFAAVATTGAYADLTGQPTIPAAQQQVDWNAASGITSIANKPTSFTPSAHTQAFSTITATPTNCAGYGITDCVTPSSLTATLAGYATTGALTSGLSGKFNSPAGSTAQYLRGDGSLATFPTAVSTFSNDSGYVTQAGARSAISLTTTGTSGSATYNSSTGVLNIPAYTNSGGTVTSITAGTGLSGGTITTSGTIILPNTGTAGTYQSVTTDAQGRVTAGLALSINDAPGRSLVTTATSTGYQISATRVAEVCYEGSFSTTSTIGGPSAASVFLETADTNSTTAGDWTIKAQQTYSNNITLAVVLNQVQGNNWSFCRYIPAGKFVRLRVGSISGTASATINSQQQETLH